MLRKLILLLVLLMTLWPLVLLAQDTAPTEDLTAVPTPSPTPPPRLVYTFSSSTRPAPDLYPDPSLWGPSSFDVDDSYMQGWLPHPRYVNGSCAWYAQSADEGMLISIDAICLSPPQRNLYRNISLTAEDLTGRTPGGTLMTYRNGVSVGVYPITKSPFELTVEVNEVFDRVGIYFRRPTVFDDVEIWY